MIKYTILLLTILQIKSDCGTINDTRCQGCKVAGTCDNCYESYWDTETKKCVIPKIKIDGCRIYKNENTCDDCHLEYHQKSETKCEKITIENCANSDKAGECNACKNGYQHSTDFKSCTDTKCKNTNCIYCMVTNMMEMCGYCKDGFAVNGIFTGCVANSKNCAALNISGSCDFCKDGYYMNKNDCVKSDIIPGLDWADDVKKLVVFAFGALVMFF